MLWHLDSYPAPWFDEGFRLNAACTLAEHGVYGTFTTAGYMNFDPSISAGPVLVAPVALAYWFFGCGLNAARLVAVAFSLVAIFAVYVLSAKLYGRHAALFISLFVLATGPLSDVGLIYLGRQVMGEVPGLACALVGFCLCESAWREERVDLAALSGIAFAFAVLAKLQFGCSLIPAVAIVGTARAWSGARVRTSMSPLVVVLAVLAMWFGIERAWTPPAVRVENTAMFAEILRVAVFGGLRGAQLGRRGLALTAVMIVAGIARGVPVLKGIRKGDHSCWPEMLLVVSVLAHAAWFALCSIGWPRYAFAGFTISLVLAGKVAWDFSHVASRHLSSHRPRYAAVIAALAVFVMLANSLPPVVLADDGGARAMAAFIQRSVPAEAVVESWEWELDVLGRHRNFHHPSEQYLYDAIEQFFMLRAATDRFERPLNLGYDPLGADPDFLVEGVFSDFTGIYRSASDRDFRKVAEFGSYRLYERVR